MSVEDRGERAPRGPVLIVLAAGIGSRYGGLKQIEPIGPSGEAILDYSVYDALQTGFGRVLFVLRRDMEEIFRLQIAHAFEDRIRTSYVFQELGDLPKGFAPPIGRKKPWGTAHALRAAREEIDAPFAVINADDFYGREAYGALAQHLASAAADNVDGEHCVVGYPLAQTLSNHGHVSRGVCKVADNGFLAEIVERSRIERTPEGIRCIETDGTWIDLPENTVVSMNMWGFSPNLRDQLEAGFRQFLQAQASSLEAECYLPTIVNDLVREGQVRVRVLQTDSRWFGVTHPEDRAAAENAIRDLVRRGVYPTKLWG